MSYVEIHGRQQCVNPMVVQAVRKRFGRGDVKYDHSIN